jgi:hypothetical protein
MPFLYTLTSHTQSRNSPQDLLPRCYVLKMLLVLAVATTWPICSFASSKWWQLRCSVSSEYQYHHQLKLRASLATELCEQGFMGNGIGIVFSWTHIMDLLPFLRQNKKTRWSFFFFRNPLPTSASAKLACREWEESRIHYISTLRIKNGSTFFYSCGRHL